MKEDIGLADAFQRRVAATALENLARQRWKYSDELPDDWRIAVSTYLKAYASDLSPLVLLEMADLLVMAGYKGEARQVLQVVLLYPSYDRGDPETARSVVELAEKAIQDL